ncbi:MAG: hypothetical protein K1X79_05145 [Oligoflexia bacterium]|nr:hypothetical protein [Oligoflexia bacterium]
MSPGSIQSAQLSSALIQKPEPKSKEDAAERQADASINGSSAEEFRKEKGVQTIAEA